MNESQLHKTSFGDQTNDGMKNCFLIFIRNMFDILDDKLFFQPISFS